MKLAYEKLEKKNQNLQFTINRKQEKITKLKS